MTGATIDHLISLTILIAALLVAMMTFNGLFASAIDYDRNRQIANKAIDITNTICLSPGNPPNWGQTNDTVSGFGLQDPKAGGYALSPYSIMRLNTASDDSQLVYYGGTDTYYNNISTSYGHAILTPLGDCVNYTTAAELLGITGSYGFSVDITPTLDVTVSPVNPEPLILNVNVTGSGLPLSGATLNYNLFHIDNTGPSVVVYSNVTQTDPSGSASISFDLGDHNPSYSFTVYVSLGGVNGVGYYTHNTAGDLPFVLPLIQDFDDGKIIIAHNWDITGDDRVHATVFCNATFFILTSDFQLQEYPLNFEPALLNYGEFKFFETQIPSSEVGLLVVSYKATGKLGSIILPWGFSSLGASASYGSGLGSGGYDFVATELRQVKIDGVSYQVKVSTWSLGD